MTVRVLQDDHLHCGLPWRVQADVGCVHGVASCVHILLQLLQQVAITGKCDAPIPDEVKTTP